MDISLTPNLMPGDAIQNTGVKAPVDGEVTDPRLLAAAQDFEAMLLESWWRSMKETFGEDDSEVGSEAMDDLGIEAMSTAVAGGGGLGLATAMLEQLRFGSRGAEAPDLEETDVPEAEVSGAAESGE